MAGKLRASCACFTCCGSTGGTVGQRVMRRREQMGKVGTEHSLPALPPQPGRPGLQRQNAGVILGSAMLRAGLSLCATDAGSIRPEVAMIQSPVVRQLRQGGVRVTPQRLAIAEAVLNSTDHPTVQQIHERVLQHFPSMTLATVYSTLGVLSKSGLIQELPFARQLRYESNVSPHVNLVCIGCGSIADADDGSEIIVRLRERVAAETGFQAMWQRVDFHGWCRPCQPVGE